MARVFKCPSEGESVTDWERSMRENLDSDGALIVATSALLQPGDVVCDEYPPLRVIGTATREEFERQQDVARRHADPEEAENMIVAPDDYRFYRTVVAD